MALSLLEAARAFQESDFNLVLLDNSFPAKDHDRLVCLIRASGSRIPIISVGGNDLTGIRSPMK
jgi:DNA-binding response OmpR family regulator